MNNDLQGNSRFSYRTKRKKTNLILNGLIVFVLLLIGIVAYSIFFSGNDNSSQKAAQPSAADKLKKDAGSKTAAAGNNNTGNASSEDQKSTAKDKGDNTTAASGQANDSSQLQNVQNPNADTTGAASQSGTHTTNYDSSSADWQAMLQSISAATGIDQSNMTVWFLGSDKSTPGGSVGTVSAKGSNQQKYRVYLHWVDGKGYQTTKVEQAAQ